MKLPEWWQPIVYSRGLWSMCHHASTINIASFDPMILQVEAKSALLKDLKDKIKENEKAQVEERAEAAAQRMLLEEDAELRKAIQEEERRRLEAENKEMLEQALVDERYVSTPVIAVVHALCSHQQAV